MLQHTVDLDTSLRKADTFTQPHKSPILITVTAMPGKQEFSRTLGRRAKGVIGPLRPPTEPEREWVRRMARKRTRVPKGVYRYGSMEQANLDWERWHAEMVEETVSSG